MIPAEILAQHQWHEGGGHYCKCGNDIGTNDDLAQHQLEVLDYRGVLVADLPKPADRIGSTPLAPLVQWNFSWDGERAAVWGADYGEVVVSGMGGFVPDEATAFGLALIAAARATNKPGGSGLL